MDRPATGAGRADAPAKRIDLNADVGEGDSAAEAEIMRVVTSVSIVCGVHAGDPSTMRRLVDLAIERGISIGAHPGLDDREGHGRRERLTAPCDAYDLVLYQVGALDAFVHAGGGVLTHVKPHGALYTMAARDAELADAIASALCDYDDTLTLVGPAGSELIRAAETHGIAAASEVFADRRYNERGELVARDRTDALITDEGAIAARVLEMLDGHLPAAEAPGIAVTADTVCIHADTPNASMLARSLRTGLERAGVTIAPLAGRGL